MDLADPRFVQLYTADDFALDPTDPRFKASSAFAGMHAEMTAACSLKAGFVELIAHQLVLWFSRRRASLWRPSKGAGRRRARSCSRGRSSHRSAPQSSSRPRTPQQVCHARDTNSI